MLSKKLLDIDNLHVRFGGRRRRVHAVNGVSLQVNAGEAIGVVGESGCGKSTLALAVLGLLDKRLTTIEGSVRFGDQELIGQPNRILRTIRGRRIAMIFQDPMTSLNPYLRIGTQLTEQIREHLHLSADEATDRAVAALREVGIPDPADRLSAYPHEFSGGMRQRVMIAMAMSCEPELLIADEPTTALDVTIQAQILAVIERQLAQRRMGMLLITHDLGIVAGACQRVAVMYAGQVVEEALAEDLFARPSHPYTRALLRAVPRVDRQQESLSTIGGSPPALVAPPTRCAFAPRCPHCTIACLESPTPLRADSRGRRHRCLEELPFSGEVE